MRAQEPDLRLRHRLHHQRHAHRSQSGAAERHEIRVTGSLGLDRRLQATREENHLRHEAKGEKKRKRKHKTITLLFNRPTYCTSHQGRFVCRDLERLHLA